MKVNSATLTSFKDQIQRDNMVTKKEKTCTQIEGTSPTMDMQESCETSLCITETTS
jgi:hypothetical protein